MSNPNYPSNKVENSDDKSIDSHFDARAKITTELDLKDLAGYSTGNIFDFTLNGKDVTMEIDKRDQVGNIIIFTGISSRTGKKIRVEFDVDDIQTLEVHYNKAEAALPDETTDSEQD